MLTQSFEATADFLHSASHPAAKRFVESLTYLEADQVLLKYRDRYTGFGDGVFSLLSDRIIMNWDDRPGYHGRP